MDNVITQIGAELNYTSVSIGRIFNQMFLIFNSDVIIIDEVSW